MPSSKTGAHAHYITPPLAVRHSSPKAEDLTVAIHLRAEEESVIPAASQQSIWGPKMRWKSSDYRWRPNYFGGTRLKQDMGAELIADFPPQGL